MNFETKEIILKNGKMCQLTDLKQEYFEQLVKNYYSFFDEVDEDPDKLGTEVGILMIYHKNSYEEEKKWFYDKLLDIESDRERVRVAIVDGKPVGVVNIIKNKHIALNHIGEMGLSIIKEYRSLGIGRALMEDILRISAGWVKIACLEVFSENTKAYDLYKKLGFIEYGRLPDAIEMRGRSFENVEMYKKLV